MKKHLIKILIVLFIAAGFTWGFSRPASANRPFYQNEVACINKTCTVVRTRTCYSVRDYNTGGLTRVCSPWSKPKKVKR